MPEPLCSHAEFDKNCASCVQTRTGKNTQHREHITDEEIMIRIDECKKIKGTKVFCMTVDEIDKRIQELSLMVRN